MHEPQKGQPARERTEVYVIYDDRFIYFGFKCFDSQPGRIAAQLTQRDSDLMSDDAVVVVLDTFHDRRSAYYFMTNALATQASNVRAFGSFRRFSDAIRTLRSHSLSVRRRASNLLRLSAPECRCGLRSDLYKSGCPDSESEVRRATLISISRTQIRADIAATVKRRTI